MEVYDKKVVNRITSQGALINADGHFRFLFLFTPFRARGYSGVCFHPYIFIGYRQGRDSWQEAHIMKLEEAVLSERRFVKGGGHWRLAVEVVPVYDQNRMFEWCISPSHIPYGMQPVIDAENSFVPSKAVSE